MAVVYTDNGKSKLWPMKTRTIIMMLTLVVSGLATFGTMSAFLRSEHGGEERTELERYVDEMLRIAQRSLFLPRPKKQIDVDAVQRPSL